MSSQLMTGWLCIATSGKTVGGLHITPSLLHTIAERYNSEYYTALIWPDGNRSESNLGCVSALKAEEVNGQVKLYAIIEPNLMFIEANQAGRYRFCTIEVLENFAKSGTPYLFGIHATDSPGSTGLSHLQFSLANTCRGQEQELEGRVPTFSARLDQLTHYHHTIKDTLMNLDDILKNFTFSTTQDVSLSPRASSLKGNALMLSIFQASPLLARMTLRFMKDPYEPTQDPIKPGLRTGRTKSERFIVKADPTSQKHQFHDFDSSAVFTRTELATLFGGLTPEQVNEIVEAITLSMLADDVLRIGFYGQLAADSTDPVTYPNGEDVAAGWQTIAKQHDPDGKRILRNQVTFDPAGAGDYRDLDSMVYRLLEVLPERWRQDPRLQVLVGGDLLALHKQAHLAPGQVRSKDQQLKIADLPVNTHQHMPGNLLAVTFLSNLQVLTLELGHYLATGDLNDDNTWGIRYLRPQTYALGAPDAYTAFDSITLTQPNEE